MWWPRGQKEVADPAGSQEVHLTEEEEGGVGCEVAGTLRLGHTCTQRPQLHRHPESRPQGFTQAHDTPLHPGSPGHTGGTATLLHTRPAHISTRRPRSLRLPAMARALSLCSFSIFTAIDLATPSSSPSNQFRPVLGLQRQTIPAYAPSLLCSLLQAAPSPTASCRGGERREGQWGERNEGKQGRESTGRKE